MQFLPTSRVQLLPTSGVQLLPPVACSYCRPAVCSYCRPVACSVQSLGRYRVLQSYFATHNQCILVLMSICMGITACHCTPLYATTARKLWYLQLYHCKHARINMHVPRVDNITTNCVHTFHFTLNAVPEVMDFTLLLESRLLDHI